MKEAEITIGFVLLNPAQAMVVRVALESYYLFTSEPNSLGEDETGKAIATGYKLNIKSVLQLIHKDISRVG